MPQIGSRSELIDEIDAEYARLTDLMERVPRELWASSRVNSAGWSLKDVLAHIADWAERCDSWCALRDTLDSMTPPASGYKWNETRQLNNAIYEKRRGHTLPRVLREFNAGHAALRERASTMNEAELLTVGRFAWCGPRWSVAQHIRANTASHYRWARKHFNAALRSEGKADRAKRTPA